MMKTDIVSSQAIIFPEWEDCRMDEENLQIYKSLSEKSEGKEESEKTWSPEMVSQ